MAADKQLFATAIAHGINPFVAASWDALLPRTPRVMVPIKVDALVVREAGGQWADCRMHEPDAGSPGQQARDLMPAPFADLAGGREVGVYLHWALPDALTRGTATDRPEDGVTFPAVPDRWLVARIGGNDVSLSRRTVTAWVIESGGKEPRVTPLAQWLEPGPVQPTGEAGAGAPGNDPVGPLTALGHGDPAWAAYFDNVTNRLGFHDDLADVTRGPLAYLVCGWYADPARDPLGDAIHSVAAFERRIDELRWQVPSDSFGHAKRTFAKIDAAKAAGLPTREAPGHGAAAAMQPGGLSIDRDDWIASAAKIDASGAPLGGYFTAAGDYWPKFTLYHGSVVGLGWPRAGIDGGGRGVLGGEEVGGPPPASKVKVALGHSLTDALAAMLVANGQSTNRARALETALLGASDDLGLPDAPAQIDSRVHAAGFGALPAAPSYETVRLTPPGAPARAKQLDPRHTAPGIFAGKVPRTGHGFGQGKRPAKGEGTSHLGVAHSGSKAFGGVDAQRDRLITDLVVEKAKAGLADVALGSAEATPRDVDVARAAPRFFIPNDPVILIQGMERSFKHGGDGLNSESGKLPCRVSGMVTRSLAPKALHKQPGTAIKGADVLAGDILHGGVPSECDELLHELALLDPGSASFAARAGARGKARPSARQVSEAAQVYTVEQTAWWSTWDPRRDNAMFIARSGFDGVLPCALAVTPPVKPWVPLHLDWDVEYVPTPAGTDDWALGEVDFDAGAAAIPGPDQRDGAIILTGRSLLTGGAARAAAATVHQALDRSHSAGGSASLAPGIVNGFHSEMARVMLMRIAEIRPQGGRNVAGAHAAEVNPDDLNSLADTLSQMDVLAGALDSFHARLRGGFTGDGHAAPDAGAPAPDPFIALRAGFLRIRRLRLVDCFGQILDLAGSSENAPVDMNMIVRSEPMTVGGHGELLELAPRFTAPSRVMFRFMTADGDAIEASDAKSPLCGFLLPDHLDGELQFHGADGAAFGSVRFDPAAGVRWEDAPGLPSAVGADPARTIANPHLAGIARGLIDWGIADVTRDDPENSDTALSAMLRSVDTALWTVDPFGHTGDEHLSLLVGHPIAVLRARLTLEVAEPIQPEVLQRHLVPVRLGALAHWQDGLLGYFVDDDYYRLHLPDPAAAGFARTVGPGQGFLQQATQTSGYYSQFASDIGVNAAQGASPVNHDFVDPSGLIHIRPGQNIMLTLLVEPHSVVNATCGLLPRKAIGMRRQWVAPGLANIAPTFRFGPVFVDAQRIRMPVASELHGSWSWCHRVDPTRWQEDEVINSRGDTQLPTSMVQGQEGWLRLTPEKPASES